MRRWLKFIALGLVALFVLIQAVPYGRDHSNPPVTQAAKWPPGPGKMLAEGSCYDCHSNLTDWRWYASIAPASWLVQNDVEEGRDALNFSEWDRGQPDLGELVEQVNGGEMPPSKYTLIHSGAGLGAEEKKQLVAALTELYANDPPPPGGGG